MQIQKSNSMIQSLQVGISIIDIIYKKDKPMRFSDIQEETGITKSNLYKYLNTLTNLEILYRDKATNMYHLGSKLIQYGTAAFGNRDVTERITPYLQELTTLTSCTVSYSVWTYNGPVTAKICHSNDVLHIGAQLGSILPPSSAAGKIFAAYLDNEQINDWISSNSQERFSTLTDLDKIVIRQNKIAFASEPLVKSISSASMPLLDHQGELLGAITVIGFNESVPSHYSEANSQGLIEFQRKVSGLFGFKGE